MDYGNKRVLITQFSLRNFAGSEITTLELAEFFSSKGAKVAVYCLSIDEPIEPFFRKIKNCKILSPKDLSVSFKDFDLVWVHHQLLPTPMLEELSGGITLPTMVFHHMSPYIALEMPYLYGLESEIASKTVFNSVESMSAQKRFFLDSHHSKIQLFPNPPGHTFLMAEPKKGYPDVPKVLVVSNHLPDELIQAVDILKKSGVVVETIGRGFREKRITPNILSSFDAVITVGKTCQYSLLLGVPVYCYDHFGGPGYLSKENYIRARKLNFSGRGFASKTSKKISDEILENYEEAKQFAKSMVGKARISFNIEAS